MEVYLIIPVFQGNSSLNRPFCSWDFVVVFISEIICVLFLSSFHFVPVKTGGYVFQWLLQIMNLGLSHERVIINSL